MKDIKHFIKLVDVFLKLSWGSKYTIGMELKYFNVDDIMIDEWTMEEVIVQDVYKHKDFKKFFKYVQTQLKLETVNDL